MLPKKKELSNIARSVALIGSFGLTIGAAILFGYYIGTYIDSKLGTAPWFMLLFLILFMIGAFIKFFQETKSVSNKRVDKIHQKGEVGYTKENIRK